MALKRKIESNDEVQKSIKKCKLSIHENKYMSINKGLHWFIQYVRWCRYRNKIASLESPVDQWVKHTLFDFHLVLLIKLYAEQASFIDVEHSGLNIFDHYLAKIRYGKYNTGHEGLQQYAKNPYILGIQYNVAQFLNPSITRAHSIVYDDENHELFVSVKKGGTYSNNTKNHDNCNYIYVYDICGNYLRRINTTPNKYGGITTLRKMGENILLLSSEIGLRGQIENKYDEICKPYFTLRSRFEDKDNIPQQVIGIHLADNFIEYLSADDIIIIHDDKPLPPPETPETRRFTYEDTWNPTDAVYNTKTDIIYSVSGLDVTHNIQNIQNCIRIHKYRHGGWWNDEFIVPTLNGKIQSNFKPWRFTLDNETNLLYIIMRNDEYINNFQYIWVVDPNSGSIVSQFGNHGNNNDQLFDPNDILINTKNNELIIADHENNRLQIFHKNGTWLRSFNGIHNMIIKKPISMCFCSKNEYIAVVNECTIYLFNMSWL